MLWKYALFQNKLDIVKAMMDCLLAKAIPCVTDCVVAELEKLGPKYRVALRLSKDPRFERLPCSHQGTYADDCLVQVRYVYAAVGGKHYFRLSALGPCVMYVRALNNVGGGGGGRNLVEGGFSLLARNSLPILGALFQLGSSGGAQQRALETCPLSQIPVCGGVLGVGA